MTLHDFFQLSMGIFAILASLFFLISIIIFIWISFKLGKLLRRLSRLLALAHESSEEVKEFISRNIDWIELQKTRLESSRLLNLIAKIFYYKKRKGEDDAENH